MTVLAIFLSGLFVTALCVGGLWFTVVEVKRIGREYDERALSAGDEPTPPRPRLSPRPHGHGHAAARGVRSQNGETVPTPVRLR